MMFSACTTADVFAGPSAPVVLSMGSAATIGCDDASVASSYKNLPAGSIAILKPAGTTKSPVLVNAPLLPSTANTLTCVGSECVYRNLPAGSTAIRGTNSLFGIGVDATCVKVPLPGSIDSVSTTPR